MARPTDRRRLPLKNSCYTHRAQKKGTCHIMGATWENIIVNQEAE